VLQAGEPPLNPGWPTLSIDTSRLPPVKNGRFPPSCQRTATQAFRQRPRLHPPTNDLAKSSLSLGNTSSSLIKAPKW
jgi:hypothetical protein